MKKITLLIIMFLSMTAVNVYAKEINIDLRYKPTTVFGDHTPDGKGIPLSKPLKITPFKDARVGDLSMVGENNEDDEPVKILSKSSVADFTTSVFRKVFNDWGAIASDNSELSLNGEIANFFVNETRLYVAKVRIRFYLKDRNGKVIWEGLGSGSAKRFGRSLKEENYNEVLSDALTEIFSRLLTDSSFLAAWSRE